MNKICLIKVELKKIKQYKINFCLNNFFVIFSILIQMCILNIFSLMILKIICISKL